jgi:hypothetical protein
LRPHVRHQYRWFPEAVCPFLIWRSVLWQCGHVFIPYSTKLIPLATPPHVVAGAAPILGAAGVADRCSTIGGSFFDAIPAGGDAYILKYIIHDWDDERATVILQRCRAAMGPGATLLLIEQVLPERAETGPGAQWGARLDLEMLVMTPGGRERTEREFRALLVDTGFALRRLVPTASPFLLLEALAV